MTPNPDLRAAPEGSQLPSEERTKRLAAAAAEAREAFDPPVEPPDEGRALCVLREGLAPVVSAYIEARTAERPVRFSAAELDRLHRATNDWLELYAACHGVEIDAEFTVREIAELVVTTHDLRDAAQLLTGVPPR